MLHGICEDILKSTMQPEEHPAWIGLTADQQAIVTRHVMFVRQHVSDHGGLLLVEYRTECPHLHPEWFGTADVVIVNPPRLTIGDLKCGRIGVEVENDDGDINPQLASYAIGVMESLDRDTRSSIREVELIVVQPRNGGVKRRLVSLPELKSMRDRLLEAGRLAETEDPPAAAGPWCTFCPAKATCETLRAHVNEKAKLDFAMADMPPSGLTGEELEEILEVASIAKMWVEAVETYAASLLSKDSMALDNWELVPKRATRKWAVLPTLVTDALVKQGLDPDTIMKNEIKTPAQIEAAARQQGVELDLTGLATAESSGMKLARRQNSDDHDHDAGW